MVRTLLAATAGFLLAAVLAACLLLEATPAVPDPPPPSPAEADHARWLAGQLNRVISHGGLQTIALPTLTLTASARLASRGLGPMRLDIDRKEGPLVAILTVPVLRHGPWRFANARVSLDSVAGAPVLREGRIGHVPVPDWLMASLTHRLLDQVCPDADLTLAQVLPRLDLTTTSLLRATLYTPPCLSAAARQQRQRLLPVDPDAVAAYRRSAQLAVCVAAQARRDRVPIRVALDIPLKAVMARARDRARTRDPMTENLAALVGLATVAGHPRLADVLGVRDEIPVLPCGRPFITLAGRRDLAQHFSLSAGLTALFAGRLSWAAGEWKELSDSLSGPTGFSFVDLAADRAGVRLALKALGPQAAATPVQVIATPAADLLPIGALPLAEGFRATGFEQRFGSVADPRYVRVVAAIDATLETTPLYRDAPRPEEHGSTGP